MSINNTQRALLANYLLGQGSSSTQGKNYVKNSFGMNGTTNVSVSGTATVAKNTTTPLTGISDFAITLPNNTTDYVEWSLDTLDNSLKNQNCQLTFDYTASSIGSAVKAQVVIGGNVSVSTDILATTSSSIPIVLNSPCGDLTGSTTVRISNTTGNSGTSSINIANVNYGKATNIGNVMQAVLLGGVKVTGCAASWQKAAAGSTLVAYTAQTGCVYTTFGNAAADTAFGSTQLPAIKFASMPAGEYRIEYEGTIGSNGSGGTVQSNQFTDGTITAREISYVVEGNSAAGQQSGISQSFAYTAPKTNVTWQLFSAVSDANNTQVFGTTAKPGVFKVYYFPPSSQQAVSSANADYDWTSYIPSFGAGFGSPTNISFFHKRRGGDLLVKGTFTTGTVAAQVGTFSLPNNLTIDTARVSVQNTTAAGGQSIGWLDANGAANLSGDIVTATGTSTTLVYLGGAIGSTSKLVPTSSVSGSFGLTSTQHVSVYFTIPISGWNENQRAPTLVGSITSNATGAYRQEYATVTTTCTTSPCTIASGNSGGWLTNITRASAGTYTANIVSGTFSAVPHCSVHNFTVNRGIIGNGDTTSTSFTFQTSDDADAKFSLFCIGPR